MEKLKHPKGKARFLHYSAIWDKIENAQIYGLEFEKEMLNMKK